MLATALSQLNRIDFKRPSVASEGNYITSKLILLKCLLELQKGKLIRNTYLKHYYQLIITTKVYRTWRSVKFDS